MDKAEIRPIPDGRLRIIRKLTETQKEALRKIKIEGLIMLNFNEVDFSPPETWIEYWFDRTIVAEVDLRAAVQSAANKKSE